MTNHINKNPRWLTSLKITIFIAGMFLFGFFGKAQAANYYINKNCVNNGDGSSWSCSNSPGGAGSFNEIPADSSCAPGGYSWQRGSIYYIAGSDLSYGTTCVRNVAGTGTITIKKPTATSHGTDIGWQSDYEIKQARLQQVVLYQGDVTLDGSYRAGPENGHGLKIITAGDYNGVDTANNRSVTNILIKYIEITHSTVGGGNYGSAAIHFYGNGNNTIQYSYLHDLSGLCVQAAKDTNYNVSSGAENLIFENNVCGRIGLHGGVGHYELIKDNGGSANAIIRNNLFYDWYSTGGIVLGDGQRDWKIYNNIFTQRTPGLICGNGVITGLTAGSNWTGNKVYNNTFANISSSCSNIFSGATGDFSGAGNEVKNNLFYNVATLKDICGSGCVKSNNWFSGCPLYTSASEEIDGTGNPFLNSAAENFHLVYSAEAINQGMSLGSSFNFDKDGISRPQGGAWDIGAYEYVSLIGDLNSDGSVNGADFNIFLSHYGSTQSGDSADFDSNGKVDIFDYNILLGNF